MIIAGRILKRIVTALPVLLLLLASARADEASLESLYAKLADPSNAEWELTQSDILREWSRSGSAAMDLLLKRGRDAMAAGDLQAAIAHLTALTDQAPDFAEGWNARATAYFMAGQYGPSVADIARTLKLNPRHFGALDGLAIILEETGDTQRALEVYRASLAIHPHQATVIQAIERLTRDAQGTDL